MSTCMSTFMHASVHMAGHTYLLTYLLTYGRTSLIVRIAAEPAIGAFVERSKAHHLLNGRVSSTDEDVATRGSHPTHVYMLHTRMCVCRCGRCDPRLTPNTCVHVAHAHVRVQMWTLRPEAHTTPMHAPSLVARTLPSCLYQMYVLMGPSVGCAACTHPSNVLMNPSVVCVAGGDGLLHLTLSSGRCESESGRQSVRL